MCCCWSVDRSGKVGRSMSVECRCGCLMFLLSSKYCFNNCITLIWKSKEAEGCNCFIFGKSESKNSLSASQSRVMSCCCCCGGGGGGILACMMFSSCVSKDGDFLFFPVDGGGTFLGRAAAGGGSGSFSCVSPGTPMFPEVLKCANQAN